MKNIKLKNVNLPVVKSAKHLGFLLSDNCLPDNDLIKKKYGFIGKCHNIIQEFHYAHPITKQKLINIYCLSMYSSPIWNLFGKEATKLYNQWNVLIRTLWNVPRETHRRLIEPISDTILLKTILMKRFVNFTKNLLKTDKESVRYLANRFIFNTESLTGMNIRRINLECKTDMLQCNKQEVNENLPFYMELPDDEQWKPSAIHEIISILKGYGTIVNERKFDEIDDFDSKELNIILNDVCCS